MEEKKSPWNKTGQWNDALELLKSIIAKTELVEMTKWGGPTYCIDNKNVLGIGGFKSYVGIWFFNGVFLKDQKQVLISANEGVTRALRQWRFTSIEDIRKNEKHILKYIDEAIANARAGLGIKPEKKQAAESELLTKALEENSDLATAFEKFTPGKRNEFMEYIADAKREETKLSRIEKIKPMILAGTGLYDKYKKS